jgi:hypothetical protein
VSSSILEQAWSETVSRWSASAAHDELFRLVHMHDAFLWAARRYREYANDHTGDEMAARQLKKISGYLMVTLLPRERPARNPYRATISILVMMLIALGAGSVFTRFAGASIANRGDADWEVGVRVSAETAPADEIAQVPVADDQVVIAMTR